MTIESILWIILGAVIVRQAFKLTQSRVRKKGFNQELTRTIAAMSRKQMVTTILYIGVYVLTLVGLRFVFTDTLWVPWMINFRLFLLGNALIVIAIAIVVVARAKEESPLSAPPVTDAIEPTGSKASTIAALIACAIAFLVLREAAIRGVPDPTKIVGKNLAVYGEQHSTADTKTAPHAPTAVKPQKTRDTLFEVKSFAITNDTWTKMEIPECDRFHVNNIHLKGRVRIKNPLGEEFTIIPGTTDPPWGAYNVFYARAEEVAHDTIYVQAHDSIP